MSSLEDELNESTGDLYQYTSEAQSILTKLEDYYDDLDFQSRNFVDDLTDKFQLYGDETFVSWKQLKWLRELEDRHT